MDSVIPYVIYLSLFRLAIIATGIISIILGYRLFAMGVFPETYGKHSGQDQSIEAEIGGTRLTVSNAAPGTVFAMFGVIIIAVMLITGGPEVTLKSFADRGETTATLRGGEVKELRSFAARALMQLERKESAAAASTADEALQSLAAPLNDLAWVLLKTDPDSQKAEFLSEVAVATDPKNAAFIHTLAEIRYQKGEKREAIRLLEGAYAIDTQFASQLEKWRSEVSKNGL